MGKGITQPLADFGGDPQDNRHLLGVKGASQRVNGPPMKILDPLEERKFMMSGVQAVVLDKYASTVVQRVLTSAREYMVAINPEHPKLTDKCSFALAVRFLRCLRGMTQHDLARASEIKQCYVSWLEKGEYDNVPAEVMARVQDFLEIPDDMIEGRTTPSPSAPQTPLVQQPVEQPEQHSDLQPEQQPEGELLPTG